MQVTKTIEETRKQIKAWKKEGKRRGYEWQSGSVQTDREKIYR